MSEVAHHFDGTGWEESAGYARAVRSGPLVSVSGTTAHAGDAEPGGVLHPGDTYGQTRVAIERGMAAVEALGDGRARVVRTRVYLAPEADWKAAARAHGEAFGEIRPANTTLHVQRLIGEGFLVEVELEAWVVEPG